MGSVLVENDVLFQQLAKKLYLCSFSHDNGKTNCEGCSDYQQCLNLWDRHVCCICVHHYMREHEYKKLVNKFKDIRQGEWI